MARCAHCGSTNTQAAVDKYNCLNCGKLTTFDGEAAESGIDADTRAVIERGLEPRTAPVVGNLADLQRAGAAVVEEGKKSTAFAEGVVPPPDHEGKSDQVTAAKSDKPKG